ncbi:MAG: type II secretion system protein GspM [Methylocella sp.]|nr:MAG: general secretion pathway protein GspM [Hyphomicrobiales bacterium]
MLRNHPIQKLFTRAHALPLLGYAALVMGLAVITWLALASLAGDYSDYTAAADLLDRLEGRKPSSEASGLASGPPGSPFLEGPTVTVAGAALQQRVVVAVRDAGGNVLSSQVDLQGSQAKQGYISLSANCEVGQSALQQLLYDLESGMPFLFIDQLVVQMPHSSGGAGVETEAARMRVQIDVSGQWQVTK